MDRSPDALLTYELDQISLKQRNAINEEVHGVHQQYMVEESPEVLRDSLQLLSVELKAIRCNSAYEKSQTYMNTWVNAD